MELEIKLVLAISLLIKLVAFNDRLGAVVNVASRITDKSFSYNKHINVKLPLLALEVLMNCMKMKMEALAAINARSMVKMHAPRNHAGVIYFL
jgi:hypothetical protein